MSSLIPYFRQWRLLNRFGHLTKLNAKIYDVTAQPFPRNLRLFAQTNKTKTTSSSYLKKFLLPNFKNIVSDLPLDNNICWTLSSAPLIIRFYINLCGLTLDTILKIHLLRNYHRNVSTNVRYIYIEYWITFCPTLSSQSHQNISI